jgi:16S rRNA (cytosine967-C5)-methyltransferase
VSSGLDINETTFSPDGFTLSHADQPIQKTSFFHEGLIRIQDEGSQCISYLVSPKENETVLDICAGTGGKTTHLAAILKNKGQIVATDRDSEKISELKKETVRMGITNTATQMADLSISLPDSLKERFDHVLVDAPCSGTGTLRRNPEIKWRICPEDLHNYTAVQKLILGNAALAVKKGGHLIYSTCSLLPEENECIIDDFIKSNEHFSLCKPPSLIKPQLLDNRNFYHTYPQANNMDGFFGVILKCQ